jgi:hypothetical protein
LLLLLILLLLLLLLLGLMLLLKRWSYIDTTVLTDCTEPMI